MKFIAKMFLILLMALSLWGDAEAWVHGKYVQQSGSNLISAAPEFLKAGNGDQLVSQ